MPYSFTNTLIAKYQCFEVHWSSLPPIAVILLARSLDCVDAIVLVLILRQVGPASVESWPRNPVGGHFEFFLLLVVAILHLLYKSTMYWSLMYLWNSPTLEMILKIRAGLHVYSLSLTSTRSPAENYPKALPSLNCCSWWARSWNAGSC